MRKTKQLSGTRVVEFYAWLPHSIDTFDGEKWVRETRWLERVKVEQRFVDSWVDQIGGYSPGYWEDIKFL